jgi:hypothetical protein
MTDYLRTISKVSNASSKKEIKVFNSILNYYYYFNNLGEKTNTQMRMKAETKSLNLLGNFKISYDKDNVVFNRIIFSSPTKMIIIIGSFMRIDDTITYHKHREMKVSVVDCQ